MSGNICPATFIQSFQNKAFIEDQVSLMFRVGGEYLVRSTDPVILERALSGGVATALVKYLLEKRIVDMALLIRSDGITGGRLFFAHDPEEVVESAGSICLSPINMAKAIRDYVPRDEKVAITVKPCEEKAIDYLVRIGRVRRENLFLIGLNCGGLFDPLSLEKTMEELSVDPDKITDIRYHDDAIEIVIDNDKSFRIDYVKGYEKLGQRDACKRCLDHTPSLSDVALGYWGVPIRTAKYTYTIPLTERGRRVLEEMLYNGYIEAVPAPPSAVEARKRIIETIRKVSMIAREKQYEVLDKAGIAMFLQKCLMCMECWHACPIRSEKEIYAWKKKLDPVLWQISVITYMYDKCVGCGACEDVCPVKIPFALIIERLRDLRRELGV